MLASSTFRSIACALDDELEFVYRLTREETTHPYEINVGDEIRIESFADPNLDRTLIVQPDGTVGTLRLLGQIRRPGTRCPTCATGWRNPTKSSTRFHRSRLHQSRSTRSSKTFGRRSSAAPAPVDKDAGAVYARRDNCPAGGRLGAGPGPDARRSKGRAGSA